MRGKQVIPELVVSMEAFYYHLYIESFPSIYFTFWEHRKSGKPSPEWTRVRGNDGNIENGRNSVNVKRGKAWKGTAGRSECSYDGKHEEGERKTRVKGTSGVGWTCGWSGWMSLIGGQYAWNRYTHRVKLKETTDVWAFHLLLNTLKYTSIKKIYILLRDTSMRLRQLKLVGMKQRNPNWYS